jgi:hypothetical protein
VINTGEEVYLVSAYHNAKGTGGFVEISGSGGAGYGIRTGSAKKRLISVRDSLMDNAIFRTPL